MAITDAMVRTGRLDYSGGFALTEDGLTWITAELGVDGVALRSGPRPVARACLDWTERRSHLAGTAGAALCQCFLRNDWVRRVGKDRAVRLTRAGEAALRDHLDFDAAALALT